MNATLKSRRLKNFEHSDHGMTDRTDMAVISASDSTVWLMSMIIGSSNASPHYRA
jgi:hypothetical protein